MLDTRVDRMQDTDRGAAPAVAACAGGAVDPGADLSNDVEVGRGDVHVAGGAIGASEVGYELCVAEQQRASCFTLR